VPLAVLGRAPVTQGVITEETELLVTPM
jgi:hypothetical protein